MAESTEVSFTGFIISLAHTAAVHFGDLPEPGTDQPGAPNLPAAQQIIDILTLLEQLLYELRMRFVALREDTPRIIQP